jgi:hypothetical protein
MVFKPGQRTNPIARLSVTGVYDDMLAEFASRELSPADKTLLTHAARLLVRAARTRSPDAQAKLSNTSLRILAQLRGRRAKRTALPPLRDMVEAVRANERTSGHPKANAGALVR